MAYDWQEIERQAIEAIKTHKLFFVADIIAYLPCTYKAFYDNHLHESEGIKSALYKNKVDVKVAMRSKWFKSNNATLQMGLMKLICEDDELRKLSMQSVDAKTEVTMPTIIDWSGGKDSSDK